MKWPILGTCLLAAIAPAASAHDAFTDYVQHTVQLSVGARHIDLTLDLTFFETWSARERTRMDADTNGMISREELEISAANALARASNAVTLRIGDVELPLLSLYKPELDLLGNRRTGNSHHRLRLFFFAPTPAGLRAGEELIVEDRLWPEAHWLGAVRAEGRDGCRLTAETTEPQPAPHSAKARRFVLRCLTPPRKLPETPNPLNRHASTPEH